MGSSFFFQLFFLALLLVPGVLFLITLQNTLNIISPENRKMQPANVWLMFIPFFNLVWQFILIDKIAQSIGAEHIRLNIPLKDPKPTYSIGLAWCICNCFFIIPLIGGLAALIMFVIYWVKINALKNLMIANQNNFLLDAEKNIFYEDSIAK